VPSSRQQPRRTPTDPRMLVVSTPTRPPRLTPQGRTLRQITAPTRVATTIRTALGREDTNMVARDDFQSATAAFWRRAGSARVASVVAVPLLLFGAGIAPAYADPGMPVPSPVPGPRLDPGLEEIDDLLETPGGGPRGGVQLPGVQVYPPQLPMPPVEAFPGVTGIPVPGVCVPGMPCFVIPLPQPDLPDVNLAPGGAPQH